VPAGKEAVATFSVAGLTVMVNDLLTVRAGELASETVATNEDVPSEPGVPVIVPVAVARVSPDGSEPEASDHW
jgi:hypothetical protein